MATLNPEPAAPEERAEQGLPPKSYATATKESLEKQQRDNEKSQNGDDTKKVKKNKEGSVDQNGDLDSETTKAKKKQEKADEKERKDKDKSSNKEKHLDSQRVLFERHTNENGEVLTSVKPAPVYEDGLKHDEEIAPRSRSSSSPTKQQNPTKQNGNKSQLKDELSSGRKAGAGWETSAIRWAPLNVPLQRRFQTVAVLFHTLSIAGFLSFFFLLCSIPIFWPLLIPYLIYTLVFSDEATSGTLSRRSQWLRKSKIWSAFASYYPARLHRTVELESTRKYIFGYHPHGIISHGAFAAFGTEALGFSDLFPGITNTLLTLDSNFRVPLYRDYLLAMGLASVSRESIENLLSKGGHNGAGMGRAVTIVVGGARESLEAQPRTLRLVLNARKGFVKLAIRTGADIVPVLSFGENDLYDQIDSEIHPWIHKSQLLVKKAMGFTIPLFHARGIFNYDVGLMPYRRPMNVVVGRPIRIKQQGARNNAVDENYLNEIHQQYVDELLRLWNQYKDTFAKERDGDLEIVE